MKYMVYTGVILISILFLVFRPITQERFDKLVWSDEFDDSGKPDDSKWGYDLGDGCPNICGWGNNELQYYTNDQTNIRVADGQLIIEVHKEKLKGKKYTSAKLKSKGKGDWKYGRVEVRAQLPKGLGTWPAIWMLPTLDRNMHWPADGEIDIMEHVGYNQDWIYGTIHTNKYNHMKGTQKSDSLEVKNASEQFHVYGVEWNDKEMIWSIDHQLYHKIEKGNDNHEGWPFDEKFHLILNVAVGGNWGGKYGVDDSIWPQQMYIDYVRIYQ